MFVRIINYQLCCVVRENLHFGPWKSLGKVLDFYYPKPVWTLSLKLGVSVQLKALNLFHLVFNLELLCLTVNGLNRWKVYMMHVLCNRWNKTHAADGLVSAHPLEFSEKNVSRDGHCQCHCHALQVLVESVDTRALADSVHVLLFLQYKVQTFGATGLKVLRLHYRSQGSRLTQAKLCRGLDTSLPHLDVSRKG